MSTPFTTLNVASSHALKTVRVHSHLVVWVRSGSKSILTPNSQLGMLTVQQNELCLLSAGYQWDVINRVGTSGRYEADVWTVPESVLLGFIDQYPMHACKPALQRAVAWRITEDWEPTWHRARQACQSDRQAIAQHRQIELLLTLADRGHVFSATQPLSWTDRVSRLVAQRPYANWSVDELAQHFLVSGSTLRSRLLAEKTNVSECIREARLELGLGLLQSTALSVGDIAGRCGYESHSRFTAAFRKRYGISPSAIRHESKMQTEGAASNSAGAQQTSATG
jgi:AraC-like DNA-binding protein